jgi:hypothetical protein
LAYLGNRPAESFASFEKQVFTIVNSQTAYTLSHSVTNENDIRLVVNSVVQEPGSGKAYTASGTTLTLSAALTNGTDTMYCVFLGRALQTVNAPNASVGSDQTAPTIITGQTAETSIATDDTILIHDTSASALRKMTRANFVSGVGGVNTPYFTARLGSQQTGLSANTFTKVNFDTEDFDTDNTFSSNRFTPTTAGKYFCFYNLMISFSGGGTVEDIRARFYKNGSTYSNLCNAQLKDYGSESLSLALFLGQSSIIDFNGSSDYLEVYARNDASGGGTIVASSNFGAYKIIE